MRRFLLPLGLAALMFSPFVTQAQPAPVPLPSPDVFARGDLLTLANAQALAAARSPVLSAARRQVEAAGGGVLQAGLLRNPTFTALVEDTRRETRTTTGTIDVPLELGGKRAARTFAAERDRQLAEAELANTQAGLWASVNAAFFEVLVGQERLKLANDSAGLASRNADAIGKRVAAGKISPVDETRARVDQTNAALEVGEAQSTLETARQVLAACWGDADLSYAAVSGDVDMLITQQLPVDLKSRLDDAPAVLVGQIEVARQRALLEVEKSKRTPDVTLTLGVKRDNELGRTQAVIGLSVPLPLFDRNQGNVYEAARRSDKAEDDYRAARVRVLNELQRATNQLTLASRTAGTLKASVLPAAEDAFRAATQGFEAGKFGFLDVIDAQRSLLSARTRFLAAQSSALQASTTVDRLLGRQDRR